MNDSVSLNIIMIKIKSELYAYLEIEFLEICIKANQAFKA